MLENEDVRFDGAFGNFAVSVVIGYIELQFLVDALSYNVKFAFVAYGIAPRTAVDNEITAFDVETAVFVLSYRFKFRDCGR